MRGLELLVSGSLKDHFGGRKKTLPGALYGLPLTDSRLKAWWDAADASTFTLSGTDVTAWADKSGHGFSLTSIGGTNKRDVAVRSMNGYPVVDLQNTAGGNYTGLGNATDTNDATFTWFWVGQYDANGCGFMNGNSNPSPQLSIGSVPGNGSAGNIALNKAWDGPVYSTVAGPGTGISLAIAARLDSTTSYLRVRSSGGGDASDSDSFGAASFSGQAFRMGGGTDINCGLNGCIAESLWYDAALTDQEIKLILEEYLVPKWGIT